MTRWHGKDDRQRVAVHHHPDGPSGTRPRGARCELAVGDDLAVRNPGELAQDATVEVGEQRDVERQVELLTRSLEVLVELAARRIDRLRRAQDPDAEVARQAVELALGLGVVGDPADAALARGHEQRADGRVDEVVRGVEQAFVGGGVRGNGGRDRGRRRSSKLLLS